MKISKEIVGLIEDRPVTYFTLINSQGATVVLSTLGAGIVSLLVPDRYGKIDEVLLGFENYKDHYLDGFGAGKTIGRYANRIGGARYSLDGETYCLAKNSGENHIHGGTIGLANRIWDYELLENGVIFTYFSPDGEDMYNGDMSVFVKYLWSEDNVLSIEMDATVSAPSVVNLTNHSYFNLSADFNSSVYDHLLMLDSSEYLVTDENLIPTGERACVEGTPMDFRRLKRIGDDIDNDFDALKRGKGYDSCWVVDRREGEDIKKVAELRDGQSGRVLKIFSTQSGVQVYTGNHLSGAALGKNGVVYKDYSGVAIECQGFPDAPNHSDFPSQFIREGERYHHIIRFDFTTI